MSVVPQLILGWWNFFFSSQPFCICGRRLYILLNQIITDDLYFITTPQFWRGVNSVHIFFSLYLASSFGVWLVHMGSDSWRIIAFYR